jgi:hypothetical protein
MSDHPFEFAQLIERGRIQVVQPDTGCAGKTWVVARPEKDTDLDLNSASASLLFYLGN